MAWDELADDPEELIADKEEVLADAAEELQADKEDLSVLGNRNETQAAIKIQAIYCNISFSLYFSLT